MNISQANSYLDSMVDAPIGAGPFVRLHVRAKTTSGRSFDATIRHGSGLWSVNVPERDGKRFRIMSRRDLVRWMVDAEAVPVDEPFGESVYDSVNADPNDPVWQSRIREMWGGAKIQVRKAHETRGGYWVCIGAGNGKWYGLDSSGEFIEGVSRSNAETWFNGMLGESTAKSHRYITRDELIAAGKRAGMGPFEQQVEAMSSFKTKDRVKLVRANFPGMAPEDSRALRTGTVIARKPIGPPDGEPLEVTMTVAWDDGETSDVRATNLQKA